MATDTDLDIQNKMIENEKKIKELEEEKRLIEEDFLQKKTKFKEMYYSRENCFQEQNKKLFEANLKIQELQKLVEKQEAEIEDIKVVASVSENTKQEAVEGLRNNHLQEIESLQRVLEDSMEEQKNEILQQFEIERCQWRSERSDLENSLVKLQKSLQNADLNENVPTCEPVGVHDHHISIVEQENETLKRKMHEICRSLEEEQKNHQHLKDVYLKDESDDTLIVDIKYLREMLTDDQWSLLKTNSCRKQQDETASISEQTTQEQFSTSHFSNDECMESPKCNKSPVEGDKTSENTWKLRYEDESKIRLHLEDQLKSLAEISTKEINLLTKKLMQFEEVLNELKILRSSKEQEDADQLNQMTTNYYKVKNHLINKLKRDQNESNSPAVQELKKSLQKSKSTLRLVISEKNEIENKLQSETCFLKSQLTAIQHSKNQIEDTLNMEIKDLQVRSASVQSQFESLLKDKTNLKMRLEKNQLTAESMRSKSREMIKSLREKLASEIANKEQAEAQLLEARNQVRSLQESLETSEQVQRDFVQLSQSLQVQLENIRIKEETEKKSDEDPDAEK